MKAPKFEQSKINRAIRVKGVQFIFKRPELDEFKEPTGEYTKMAVNGIYHETTQHISIVGSEASSVQSKQTPYILALYEDAKDLEQGDTVEIDGTVYVVNGLLDFNHWHIAIDINLEAVV